MFEADQAHGSSFAASAAPKGTALPVWGHNDLHIALYLQPFHRESHAERAFAWHGNCIDIRVMLKIANRATQLAELRASLLSRRSELASDRRRKREVLQTPQNVAVDDQVSILHEQFVALAHHRRDRETLALIDAALERIDRDEFGICEECEGDIPPARLRAVPWASFCVPCQEHTEKNNTGAPVEELLSGYS